MKKFYLILENKFAKILCLLVFFSGYPTGTYGVNNHTQARPIWPPLLKKGDQVAIVAPAYTHPDIRRKVENAAKLLQSWGLQVVLGKHLYSKKDTLFAGKDSERLEDLQQALDDPAIKAVLAFRGGYGTTRIVDKIDYTRLQQSPKWLIGFSDITTFLIKLHELNIVSIHGEMPVHFSESGYETSIESLKTLLWNGNTQLTASPHPKNRIGEVEALVVGGNLTLLCSNMETLSALDTKGKILVIEEIGEKSYRLDRMIVQLKRAGMLKHLAGLVVGQIVWTPSDTEGDLKKCPQEIITEHVSEYGYPVAFNFPIGHRPPNIAFPHGAVGRLCVTDQGASLTFGHNREQ